MIFTRTKVLILILLFNVNTILVSQENRSIDGSNNNVNNPAWGTAGDDLKTLVSNGFGNGFSSPSVININARKISNILFAQEESIVDGRGLSDYLWAFGQFLDHDIILVDNGSEYYPIVIDQNDPVMEGEIPFLRSKFKSGTGVQNIPRVYKNEITSFIDGSNIYGSTTARNFYLRSFSNGKLRVSKGDKLPWNTIDGEFNSSVDHTAPSMADDVGRSRKHFVSGDVRANENLLLTSFHTLFTREHNRICDELVSEHPDWNDDQLFEYARKLVGAIIQNITYNEWLPAMGIELPQYTGYDNEINPAISNVFSASAFRMGHTLLNGTILRMDNDGNTISRGNIPLYEAFFNPIELLRTDISAYFKGMGVQMQQHMDCKMVDAVRNLLFKLPGVGNVGIDLAAINIQRGRDRGLPDYNTVRQDFSLTRIERFEDITDNLKVIDILRDLYTNVDEIDSWVGFLAEKHVPNTMLGESLLRILSSQFANLRDGDRFFFENDVDIDLDTKEWILSSTLKSVILRNTTIECLQDDVMVMKPHVEITCWPFVVHKNLDFSIAPNPIDESTLLNIYSTDNTTAYARILSVDGKEVWSKIYTLIEGENHLELNLNRNIGRGMYFLIFEQDDDFRVRKIFKN